MQTVFYSQKKHFQQFEDTVDPQPGIKTFICFARGLLAPAPSEYTFIQSKDGGLPGWPVRRVTAETSTAGTSTVMAHGSGHVRVTDSRRKDVSSAVA